MITTNKIEAKVDKGPRVLSSVSTKTVDANPKEIIRPPQGSGKPDVSLTTQAVGDPADAAEKLKRAGVMEEKTNFQKGDAVYQGENGEPTVKPKDEATIEEFAKETGAEIAVEEKKLAVKDRMAKVRAARSKKK